jgi:hypothetical protein
MFITQHVKIQIMPNVKREVQITSVSVSKKVNEGYHFLLKSANNLQTATFSLLQEVITVHKQ